MRCNCNFVESFSENVILQLNHNNGHSSGCLGCVSARFNPILTTFLCRCVYSYVHRWWRYELTVRWYNIVDWIQLRRVQSKQSSVSVCGHIYLSHRAPYLTTKSTYTLSIRVSLYRQLFCIVEEFAAYSDEYRHIWLRSMSKTVICSTYTKPHTKNAEKPTWINPQETLCLYYTFAWLRYSMAVASSVVRYIRHCNK